MYIIVGLGNPGKKYENTRHNMGFIAVDLLAEKYGIKVDKIKFKALVGEGRIAGRKVLLCQTADLYESERTKRDGGDEFLQRRHRKPHCDLR